MNHHTRYRIVLLLILLATLLVFLMLSIALYRKWFFLSFIAGVSLPVLVFWLIKHAESFFSEFLEFTESVQNLDFTTLVPVSSSDSSFHQILSAMMEQVRAASIDRAEQKQYLQMIIDYLPIAVLALNHNGEVTLFNRRFSKIFRVNKYNLVAELEESYPFMRKALSGKPRSREVVTIDSANYVLSASVIGLASGKQRLFTFQNISEELSSQEMDAWKNLLRVLAHEIMNSMTPLTSLSQSAGEVLKSVELDGLDDYSKQQLERVEKALDVITQRGEALSHFVSSYRQLTKPLSPVFAKVSVQELCADVVRFMNPKMEQKTIEFSLDIQPKDLQVIVDKALIEQVLINLIKNAIEACSENQSKKIKIDISAEQKGGSIVIVVEDNGPGIPEAHELDVFVPFFTTKRKGSGVGLSVCKQILKAHNAKLKLVEKQLPGTRISMIFS